ncbi:DHHA1 domain-containing protein [Chloroflexota bacterium]
MTERLYYTDATLTSFMARVVERGIIDDHPAVVLDQSCFYPTSGGQPFDTGHLNGVPVLDVQAIVDENGDEAGHATGGAVWHILGADLTALEVTGTIDWPRRFDHMQHHTGQHILTQAFIEIANAPTVSFHLGEATVTLDLATANLTEATLKAVEERANQIVWQNLAVKAWFPDRAELAALPLRKVPAGYDKLRIVGIGDVDFTACGGTHVQQTGEVGLIKIIGTEKIKGQTRVEFACGGRALADYHSKNAVLHRLSTDLTTGYREIGDSIAKLRAENKALRAELKTARQALLVLEAQELLAAASNENGRRVIVGVWTDRDPGELRPLASRLVEEPGTVALLALAGQKAQVIMARAADRDDLDMVAFLRATMGVLTGDPDSRRGGGRPEFAQGGGIAADEAALQRALAELADQIRATAQG